MGKLDRISEEEVEFFDNFGGRSAAIIRELNALAQAEARVTAAFRAYHQQQEELASYRRMKSLNERILNASQEELVELAHKLCSED
jgi:hypothetical protein